MSARPAVRVITTDIVYNVIVTKRQKLQHLPAIFVRMNNNYKCYNRRRKTKHHTTKEFSKIKTKNFRRNAHAEYTKPASAKTTRSATGPARILNTRRLPTGNDRGRIGFAAAAAAPRPGRARRAGRRLRRGPSGRPPLAANRTDRYARDLRDDRGSGVHARTYGCQRDGTKILEFIPYARSVGVTAGPRAEERIPGGTRFSSRTAASCSGTRRHDESTPRLGSVSATLSGRRDDECTRLGVVTRYYRRDLVGRYEWTNTIMIRFRPQRYASEPVRNERRVVGRCLPYTVHRRKTSVCHLFNHIITMIK